MNNRIFWCDYLKGICMMGVLAIHLGVPNIVYRSFSPLFLTGFFFVSGYLNGGKVKDFIWLRRRVRSLVIPFLSFGMINLTINSIFDYSFSSFLSVFSKFILQISGFGGDILWFISCLITCEIINWLVVNISKNYQNVKIFIYFCLCILGFILSFHNIHLLWHIETAFVMSAFVFVGELYRIYEEKILNKHIWRTLIPLLCLVIYIVLYILFPNEYIDVHLGIYTNIVVFMISALSGLYFLIFLCKKNRILFLQFIGQNTLIYYAFQIKCFFVFKKIIRFDNYVISWCIIYILSLLALGIGSKFISSYFPILLGRNQK